MIQDLTIHYFAALREQRGCSQETVQTSASTPAELYAELCKQHPLTIDRAHLRVAINGAYGDWDAWLTDGDEVVFIQPVAGG